MDLRPEPVYEELACSAQAAKSEKVSPTPDHVIERYRNNSLWWIFPREMLFKSLQGIRGKEILDMGCGDGEIGTRLAKLGARVTGVDVLPGRIRKAALQAELDGVQDRTQFLVRNVLESPLPECQFDIVVCSHFLHHVDLRRVLPLLWASLKPGGVAVMIEPVSLSPLLRKLRKLVPVVGYAGADKPPLNQEELNFVLKTFADTRTTYYEIFSRLQIFLPNRDRTDRGHPCTKAILILLGCIDRLLLRLFPILSAFAGEVVIVGSKRSSNEVTPGAEPAAS
jgi:SAM-dependent methyltransferase